VVRVVTGDDKGRDTLSPIWQQATQAELEWRRSGVRLLLSEERPHLTLEPGRHRVRVAFVIHPSRVNTGDGFRAISNPVRIEILPAPEASENKVDR